MKSKVLDQFYTRKEVAKQCFAFLKKTLTNKLGLEGPYYWLEPSAGTGAFFNLLPEENRLGIDLDPQVDGIISSDFLDYDLPRTDYITVGNPPFGKNASLALKFINKAAAHSQVVAFIVPKTFKKESLVNRIDSSLHLAAELPLIENAFVFNEKDYAVPCVFQVWVKKQTPRIKWKSALTHKDFSFVKREEADIAFQRVGVNAGRVKKEFNNVAASSHYFIKASPEVVRNLESIDWNRVKHNTAGNPSISRGELVRLYELNF